MKIWIVGAQGTGKLELAKLLDSTEKDLKVGKLFTNLPQDSEESKSLYHHDLYNFYTREDVSEIFENNAYILLNSLTCEYADYYEGLDLNEYDSNNVFVISLNQFTLINNKYISKDDLVVWLDGNYVWRLGNIENSIENGMEYDYLTKEAEERSTYESFYSNIMSISGSGKNVLYFYNELPERVSTIVKTLYNNPKLKKDFCREFFK